MMATKINDLKETNKQKAFWNHRTQVGTGWQSFTNILLKASWKQVIQSFNYHIIYIIYELLKNLNVDMLTIQANWFLGI